MHQDRQALRLVVETYRQYSVERDSCLMRSSEAGRCGRLEQSPDAADKRVLVFDENRAPIRRLFSPVSAVKVSSCRVGAGGPGTGVNSCVIVRNRLLAISSEVTTLAGSQERPYF